MVIVKEKKKDNLQEMINLSDVNGSKGFRFLRFNCGDVVSDFLPINNNNVLIKGKGQFSNNDVMLLSGTNKILLCFEEKDIKEIRSSGKIITFRLINSWIDFCK